MALRPSFLFGCNPEKQRGINCFKAVVDVAKAEGAA